MRIFFVCQRVPFPPDRGDKITTFNEIRHLSTEHEVHVFCLGDGSGDLANVPGSARLRAERYGSARDRVDEPAARAQGALRGGTAFGGGFQRGEIACGDQAEIRRTEARSDHGL